MDENTRKTSFGKWIAPINSKNLLNQVNNLKQDSYPKKLSTEAYIRLMFYAQLHETEGLQVLRDALISADFQSVNGFESISASKLSRKNSEIDPSIDSSYFIYGFCLSDTQLSQYSLYETTFKNHWSKQIAP